MEFRSGTSKLCEDDGDPGAEDGSVKDIQAHLRHAKADTTANEYMQELPESVKRMVGEVYAMLTKGGEEKTSSEDLLPNATNASEEVLVTD